MEAKSGSLYFVHRYSGLQMVAVQINHPATRDFSLISYSIRTANRYKLFFSIVIEAAWGLIEGKA
jgi:hypothetical protein